MLLHSMAFEAVEDLKEISCPVELEEVGTLDIKVLPELQTTLEKLVSPSSFDLSLLYQTQKLSQSNPVMPCRIRDRLSSL